MQKKDKFEPIFPAEFLNKHLADFRLSSIAGITQIVAELKVIITELNSGKLEGQTELGIKSRFIHLFFGTVLGFRAAGTEKWTLQEELRTVSDPTRPDASLGYFYLNAHKQDIRAVIEMKGIKSDLDKKQGSKKDMTPVDQAFTYASKTGGKCKWVIVSNIKEIRFYPANDRSKCQRFFLAELSDESKLKELVFLFHKSRFFKEEGASQTDLLWEKSKKNTATYPEPVHIIDQLYHSIKKFEGLGFVDPNFLVTLRPFNILDEWVWHYSGRTLFTLNPDIFKLLSQITIKDKEVIFDEELAKVIEAVPVIDATMKMKSVFRFLNECMIVNIAAIKDYTAVASRNKRTIGFSIRSDFNFKSPEEGIRKNIWVLDDNKCGCVSCMYRSLDFTTLFKKLKAAEGSEQAVTLEFAFGHYLTATNNFKTSYTLLKQLEQRYFQREGQGVRYFVSKYNQRLLYNLVKDYDQADLKDILSEIKSINLDKIIYDELEFEIDSDVRNYLLRLKEDEFIYKIQDEIEELTEKVDELCRLYETGGTLVSGPDYFRLLEEQYFLLYLHINRNYLFYDSFRRYKTLTKKVFQAMLKLQQLPIGNTIKFSSFILLEAILHVDRDSLQKVLKFVQLIRAEDAEELTGKLIRYTGSYFKTSFFNDPYPDSLMAEQLHNHRFQHKFTDLFTNLFSILCRLDISKEQFADCVKPLISFLKIENELSWYNLKEFCRFIRVKGNLFEKEDLMLLLETAIHRYQHHSDKYEELIKTIPNALIKYYPDFRITKKQLINAAIHSSYPPDEGRPNFNHLLSLANVCAPDCQELLFNAFEEYLDQRFNADFYEQLLLDTNYDYKKKNYFYAYTLATSARKGPNVFRFGKKEMTDLLFFNYTIVVYSRKVNFESEEFSIFENLNNFESWLLHPYQFDYNLFDAGWLPDLDGTCILKTLAGHEPIALGVDAALSSRFDPQLAKIYYTYFKQPTNEVVG